MIYLVCTTNSYEKYAKRYSFGAKDEKKKQPNEEIGVDKSLLREK